MKMRVSPARFRALHASMIRQQQVSTARSSNAQSQKHSLYVTAATTAHKVQWKEQKTKKRNSKKKRGNMSIADTQTQTHSGAKVEEKMKKKKSSFKKSIDANHYTGSSGGNGGHCSLICKQISISSNLGSKLPTKSIVHCVWGIMSRAGRKSKRIIVEFQWQKWSRIFYRQPRAI